jgi:hypothetical protein
MDIHMSDVMLHIDETLNSKQQEVLEAQVRNQQGVVGLGYHEKQPHLMIVEYDQDKTTPQQLLHHLQDYGLHAEIVSML